MCDAVFWVKSCYLFSSFCLVYAHLKTFNETVLVLIFILNSMKWSLHLSQVCGRLRSWQDMRGQSTMQDTNEGWHRQHESDWMRVCNSLSLSEKMGLGDLLSPLVEQMIDWYRLREGSLKQMGLLARRRNKGLATTLGHTEARLSGRVTETEVEMAGSKMRGENFWPPTAWKLQWTRVLIHWKVMQLKVTLRINSQPDKNRIVTEKKQVSAFFSLPGVTEHSKGSSCSLCNYTNKCRKK